MIAGLPFYLLWIYISDSMTTTASVHFQTGKMMQQIIRPIWLVGYRLDHENVSFFFSCTLCLRVLVPNKNAGLVNSKFVGFFVFDRRLNTPCCKRCSRKSKQIAYKCTQKRPSQMNYSTFFRLTVGEKLLISNQASENKLQQSWWGESIFRYEICMVCIRR